MAEPSTSRHVERQQKILRTGTPPEAKVFINLTAKGEKKDLSGDLSKNAYSPLEVEAAWYDWWMAKGFFAPIFKDGTRKGIPNMEGKDTIYTGEIREEGLFVMPAPPPNVTGDLHLGHALTVAVQDTLVRWYRMKGYTTLHVPGFDHAGISTQSVVENMLLKTEGKSRHDYGREAFLSKVWEWKDRYHSRTLSQIQRLGTSSDWSRVAFTLDPQMVTAVNEAFYQLHQKGMIYRANRLVNWCVKLQTTLSNVEVDQKVLTGRTLLTVPGYEPYERFEFGVLVSFAYQIEGSEDLVIVATSRPETMLGDSAIAVHPDDSRYKHLHGKFATHPFLSRRLPVICDATVVDMEYGTGAVKITPAHDSDDYACGKRHELEFINVLNDDGTLNENAGVQFQGMKRFHARIAVIEALKARGLYVDTKDNPMQIPICSKSGDMIEMLMKPQWWIDFKDTFPEVLEQMAAGKLDIKPKSCASELSRWLANPQDWCISRQLWWGHRIPAYRIVMDGSDANGAATENWVVGRTEPEAREAALKLADGQPFTLQQDQDVLDTWFSAGLWPFAIMGWPHSTTDFEKFYPSQMLETGWDILPFWVLRMVLLGYTLTGQIPFREVLCHPLIRDPEGRKMSKSLGNVIDPVDIIEGIDLNALRNKLKQGNLPDHEIQRAMLGQKKLFPKGISQCGTDALRFGLCNYMTGSRDVVLNLSDIQGYRKFCNKIWNATKFSMFKLGMVDIAGTRLGYTFVPNQSDSTAGHKSLAERWILHKLNEAADSINFHLSRRAFHEATEKMYGFWLHEFCDIFIEVAKVLIATETSAETQNSAKNTLYTCLETALRLLHPVMPYITEDLWQRLPRRPGCSVETIMLCPYPTKVTSKRGQSNLQGEADFDLIIGCVRAARSIMARHGLATNGKTFDDRHDILIQVSDEATSNMIQAQCAVLLSIIKGSRSIHVIDKASTSAIGCSVETVNPMVTVLIKVEGKIDPAVEGSKMERKLATLQTKKDKLAKLAAPSKSGNTIPDHVRESNAVKMGTIDEEMEILRSALKGLSM
ncbi:hypothetical protein QFC22_005078 [Naganishia vaughanmartiniae]|uniref:Uncharacterized protein n=1 Tax=Naganishia vaughanmartiniae TaxID=1424756 RepID=A0ACC2WXQ2_9TREE|nr:hypothetical protein QFC22_005078 [Naganishia vaughanmartiniae]